MTMKYIVTVRKIGAVKAEEIYVFPKAINHDEMFERLREVKFGEGRDWHRNFDAEAISAGFVGVSETGGPFCFGNSGTLGLKSRGPIDTLLLKGSL